MTEAVQQKFEFVDAASDDRVVNNTFRSQYRVLTDHEKALMSSIKGIASEMEILLDTVAASREVSLAKTKLEEAVMWAVKGLTK